MLSKKETLVEKLLKPIRINPVTLGASLTCFGIGSLLFSSDSIPAQISSVVMFCLGGPPFFIYLKYGLKSYLRDIQVLAEHGFDVRYGKLRMEEYCDRQAFYVACVEKGYREEAKTLIDNTPNNQKRGRLFPHI
jgi:hypothetical protein